MTVLLCVAAVLLLLLLCPVRVWVRLDPEPSLDLGYLFLKWSILPVKDKPPRVKKPRKKKSPSPSEKPEKAPKKPSAEDVKTGLLLLLRLLPRLWRPIRTLLRRTVLAKLELSLRVAGRDAADTALAFGKASTAVYSMLAATSQVVTLRVKRIEILPDFIAAKTVLLLAVELRLLPLFALAAGCNLAGIALGTLIQTALQKSRAGVPDSADAAFAAERNRVDGNQ
ncbi:MAG: DUF2953 domain-containing protein [Oscillospiraceae bacterium]